MRPSHVRAAMAAVMLGTGALHAQRAPVSSRAFVRKPVGLLLASRQPSIPADPGTTVTASFSVTNPSLDSLTVTPRIVVPADWTVVLGSEAFSLASRQTDSWFVSVRVPARATAGRYGIQLRANDPWGHVVLIDSLLIDVRERRRADIALSERPPHAISGTSYAVGFLVRNSGNVATTYALRAASSFGTVRDSSTQLTLGANESKVVRVSASTTLHGTEAVDDVVLLHITDARDSTVHATGSARITVVPKAGTSEDLHTVASTLRVRAADAAAGVSRYELTGAGRLRDGGNEQLSFVMRSKPTPGSPFGDREEYFVGLRGTRFNAQLGDALYIAAPLTSAGQRGFGGGLTLGDSSLGVGGYAQRFRFPLDGSTERGAFLRAGRRDIFASPHLGLSGVERPDGAFAGKVLDGAATLTPMHEVVVDVEYAASSAAQGRGVARSARVAAGEGLHVELGHLDADSSFAGPAHGSRYDYAAFNTAVHRQMQLRASYTASRTTTTFLGTDNTHRTDMGLVELTYQSRFAIGFTSYERGSDLGLFSSSETQRGITARAEQGFGVLRAWGTAEAGRAISLLDTASHGYGMLSGGVSGQLGANLFTLFGETSRSASVLRGADRVATLGLDAQLQLTASTRFAVTGSDTRSHGPDAGYTALDARLMQSLPNGATLTARVRLGGQDIHEAAVGPHLAYLEYSTPLQLPIGPSRAPGRVRGRVVDQQTGRGVAGALVRLGPQAAITDGDGRVAFAGLPAGAYRVSLAQQLASGSSVFNGDPDVTVDSAVRRPATFNVAVEPAGRISGTLTRRIIVRTGVGEAADSLGDGGLVDGMTIALIGQRDTLYRTSDASGRYEFTDVPSGAWTIVVMGEIPPQTAWEHERVPIVLKAGEKVTVSFRLVPRRRQVKIVSGDGIDESKIQR